MKVWSEEKHAPNVGDVLCPLSAVQIGATKEFEFGDSPKTKFRMFVYRSCEDIRGFLNKCPHFNVPLNIEPGELFSADRLHFQCCHHYAKFDKITGVCTEGPCEGRALLQIPVRVIDDQVVISADHHV